jgi:hypothetical protein
VRIDSQHTRNAFASNSRRAHGFLSLMHSKTLLNTESSARPVPEVPLMPVESLASMRELDYRFVNGLQVQLWWDPDTSCTWVSVRDARTESQFLIEVGDGERPLDVFHHPFAYAPRQRLAAALAGASPAYSRRAE